MLDKNRTVIFLPYANSQRYIDLNFWAKMANELKAQNYIVYTNVDGIREKPVEGTEPMTTTFAELNYLADKVKCFAGFRSGIFDLLAFTSAKLLNITPFNSWSGDLNILQPGCNNRTFYSAVEYLQPIHGYFNKDLGVKADIRLSDEHISHFDIYYSYEDIFNAMLRFILQI